MAGNPAGSPWRSTPAGKRSRKALTLTLAATEREQLETLAQRHGVPLSRMVAAAVAELDKRSAAAVDRALKEAAKAA